MASTESRLVSRQSSYLILAGEEPGQLGLHGEQVCLQTVLLPNDQQEVSGLEASASLADVNAKVSNDLILSHAPTLSFFSFIGSIVMLKFVKLSKKLTFFISHFMHFGR